jgi:hypothetical protein
VQSLQRLAYEMDGTGYKFRQGQVVVCSSQPSRPALGPTQPPIQWVPGSFPGRKAAGADVNLSPPYSAQIKSECAILLMPLNLSDPMSDLVRHYDFPVSDAFPHILRTSANR